MNLTDQLLRGTPAGWLPILLMYLLGVLTLVFSMIVASRLAGGIDFGPASFVVPRGALLLAVVTVVNLLDCGVLLAAPIWYLGLMFLFHLDKRQTGLLTQINWSMNLIWKLLLLTWRL